MSTQITETFAEIGIPPNPFPGLRPFEFDESHLFFGRDGQSERLIAKLSRTHFLAVVGTSGSGKSSLVRAGFLPALHGGFMTTAGSTWRVAIMRPGNDPIGNLARALNAQDVFGSEIEENVTIQAALAEATLRRGARGLVDAVRQAVMPDNENLLVVVDQFEEIFRFARVTEDKEYGNEAAGFVKLLLEAANQREIPIYVVLTMRSDYLGDCSQFWDLPEAINESQYLIPRLTRDQLREAITGPVAVGGAKITPRLVNRLLNDVGDNQDQLPVLQHLLMRMWDEWKAPGPGKDSRGSAHNQTHEGDAIDLCCYEAVGGMSQALSLHADEAFHGLPDDRHRAVAEKVFKALTEKGPDNREVRRPITVGELSAVTGATAAEVITVVEAFRQPGRSFVMAPADAGLKPESLIDLSHESLIRGWVRLKEWVEEEARSARTYQRLASTAVLHQAGEEALLQDPALQVALDWRDANRPNAAWARRYHPAFDVAMNYLEASVAARDAEMRERERQSRRDVSYKRTRLVALLLALSVLLALGSAVYAFRQGSNAEKARAVAVQKSQEALDQKRVAVEQSERANDQAANAKRQSNEAIRQGMLAAVASKKADEQRILAQSEKKRADELRALAEIEKRKATVQAFLAKDNAYRADQLAEKNRQLLYPADINLAQQAYEANNLERGSELLDLHTAEHGDQPGYEWSYLWRLLHPERESLGTMTGGRLPVTVSKDGRIAVAKGPTVELRNPAGSERQTLTLSDEGEKVRVTSLALTADGKTLAVAESSISGIKFFDTATNKQSGLLKKWADQIFFAPDGKTFVTGGLGADLTIWDYSSLHEKGKIGADYQHLFFAHSPDGQFVLTMSVLQADIQSGKEAVHSALIWDAATGKQVGKLLEEELRKQPTLPSAAAFSPDNKQVALASRSFVLVLDVASGILVSSMEGRRELVTALAFSPDNRVLAAGYNDGAITLTSIDQPSMGMRQELLATLKGQAGAIDSLSFADGQFLVSRDRGELNGSNGGTIWNVGSLIAERTPRMLPLSEPGQLVYSPDGRLIAAPANSNNVRVLEADSLKELSPFMGHKSTVRAADFSPDGKLLASASDDKTVRIWDVATRAQIGPAHSHTNGSFSVAFSPNGKLLVSACLSGEVKLWNVVTGAEVATFGTGENERPDDALIQVAFSADGQRIVLRYRERLELRDLTLSKQLAGFTPQKTEAIRSMAVSRERGILAIGVSDNRIQLLDDAELKVKDTLKGHAESVDALGFSKDGTRLASGDGSGLVKVWDIRADRELLTFQQSPYGMKSVAFAPDGLTLASLDGLNYLRFYRAATEAQVAAQKNR